MAAVRDSEDGGGEVARSRGRRTRGGAGRWRWVERDALPPLAVSRCRVSVSLLYRLHLRAEPKRGRPSTGLFELGLQLHLRAEPKRGRAGTGLFELVNYRIWWEDRLRRAGTRLFEMLRAEPKRRPGTGLFELGLQLHLRAEPKRGRPGTGLFELGLQLHLWAEPKGDRPSKGLFELGLQLHLWAEPKREAKQIEAADCSRTKSENEGKNERSVQKQESIRSKNKGV
uniref:Uncharacterized protein n=1 Tax=Oryza rufipogon TaxID=4529 RepID=A0A0E0REE6_ORYRU